MFWFNFLSQVLSPGCTEAVYNLAPARIFTVGVTSPRHEFLFLPSFFFSFLLEGLKIHPVLLPTPYLSLKLKILNTKSMLLKGNIRWGSLSLCSTGLGAFFSLTGAEPGLLHGVHYLHCVTQSPPERIKFWSLLLWSLSLVEMNKMSNATSAVLCIALDITS